MAARTAAPLKLLCMKASSQYATGVCVCVYIFCDVKCLQQGVIVHLFYVLIDYAHYFEPNMMDIHFECACFFLGPLALPPPPLPDRVISHIKSPFIDVVVVIIMVCV